MLSLPDSFTGDIHMRFHLSSTSTQRHFFSRSFFIQRSPLIYVSVSYARQQCLSALNLLGICVGFSASWIRRSGSFSGLQTASLFCQLRSVHSLLKYFCLICADSNLCPDCRANSRCVKHLNYPSRPASLTTIDLLENVTFISAPSFLNLLTPLPPSTPPPRKPRWTGGVPLRLSHHLNRRRLTELDDLLLIWRGQVSVGSILYSVHITPPLHPAPPPSPPTFSHISSYGLPSFSFL